LSRARKSRNHEKEDMSDWKKRKFERKAKKKRQKGRHNEKKNDGGGRNHGQFA
jgi:hypothetical protein